MDVVQATDAPASEQVSILKACEEDERALQRAGWSPGEHADLHRVQDALARLSQDLFFENRPENSSQ
jgi:hypothetical protein